MLLVPSWMGDLHWLLFATAFWAFTFWCWRLYRVTEDVRAVGLGTTWLFIAMIATCFWLIQSALFGLDPVWLFAVERICWYPLAVSAAINVDMLAADLNGHRSLIQRLDHLITKRKVTNVHTQQ